MPFARDYSEEPEYSYFATLLEFRSKAAACVVHNRPAMRK
jgi:hypothetical protein